MLDVTVDDHGKVQVIHIKGEFYIETIQQMEDQWSGLISKKPQTVAIDCAELEYVDSSAIAALVKFLNTAMEKGIKLVFYDLSPSIRSLFETSRLIKFFTVTTKSKFETEHLPRI